MEDQVIIYTDGASKGNPGPGGYGAVLMYKNHRKELSAGYRKTTNNRMELMAVIAALEALTKENLTITVYSDSKYVVDALEKGWVRKWIQKGFKGKKNPDLWKRLIKLYDKHKVSMKWVKGHASITENERCDKLAVEAAEFPDFQDKGYESGENN